MNGMMEIIKIMNTIPSNPVMIMVIILIHGQSTMMIWITLVLNIQLEFLNSQRGEGDI
jgi:ABC-type dipeptide/oligopeptide/nickel transport system permease subunit